MLRKALVSGICSLLCLVGSAANKKYEGLKYSTTAVKTGVWSTQFAKCKKLAAKKGVPLIVLWVNPGCGYCRALCSSIAASQSFSEWRKSCDYVFVLGIGSKTSVGKKVKAFAKSDGKTQLSSFPFCAVYLDPLGKTSPVLKKVFIGRSPGGGMTVTEFRKKIKSARKKYVKITLKAEKGGVVRQIRWQKIGKRVTIKAISDRGYRFLGWYDKKGKRVSRMASYKVKIAKTMTYTAKFKKE